MPSSVPAGGVSLPGLSGNRPRSSLLHWK
jgi:hypothetical protein